MRGMTLLLVSLLVLAPVAAVAQEAAPELPEDIAAKVEMFRAMGIEEEGALFMAVMTSGGMDPAQLMLLMAMMEGGGQMRGVGPMMMLMNATGGKGGGKQPVTLDRGESLLIIEDGVLYVVDLEQMEVKGSLAYTRAGQADAQNLMALLGPVFAKAQAKAQQASCLSNMKQLGLTMLMYAQDWDEKLPGETWVADIEPYHNNNALLVCPSRPDLPIGYAMNEKLPGASLGRIERPAEVVVLFESNLGGDNPLGGPDAVPEEGVHNEGINCAFADGHCKWLSVAAARELLEQDPFQ